MRLLIAVSTLVAVTLAAKGLDTTVTLSKNTFHCLKENGYSFLITRIWHSTGNLDETGIQNIKVAAEAGWSDVGAYIYPCLASHCAGGAQQVEAALDHLKAAGAKVNIVWMDIEGKWPTDHLKNLDFIQGMVKAAEGRGYKVGIYTGQYSWPEIVGSSTALSHLPLWWPNYNKKENNDNFPHYGGWTKPLIHQYNGDQKGPCGVYDLDFNYKA